MLPLAAAIFTAALGLMAKVLFDLWGRYRGVAGALAGELGAYIDLVRPAETAGNLRTTAGLGREDRLMVLRTYPALPTSHPVFDKVADKRGVLAYQEALGVSRAYNVVTGMRLLMMNMSTPGFLDATDGVHQQRLNFIAETMEREGPTGLELVAMLKGTAAEGFWTFVRGSVAVREGRLASPLPAPPRVPPG